MPNAVRAITRVQDQDDVEGSFQDGDVPIYDGVLQKFVPGAIAGLGDSRYHYHQELASATWLIQHNLGKVPSVTVFDSAGTVVEGDILPDTLDPNNKLVLDFSAAFSGDAYLN